MEPEPIPHRPTPSATERVRAKLAALAGDRLFVNVEEAAEFLDMTRSVMYAALKRGRIPCLRNGTRLKISVATLETIALGRDSDPPIVDRTTPLRRKAR